MTDLPDVPHARRPFLTVWWTLLPGNISPDGLVKIAHHIRNTSPFAFDLHALSSNRLASPVAEGLMDILSTTHFVLNYCSLVPGNVYATVSPHNKTTLLVSNWLLPVNQYEASRPILKRDCLACYTETFYGLKDDKY